MRYIVELNQRQSARVLDNAARAGAQILVELAGNAVEPVPGQLVSADEAVLVACLLRSPAPNPRTLVGRYVDVQIYTDPRYYFTTHILRTGDAAEPNQLALRRPDVIQVIQRRRFWRAQLAPSSNVLLSWSTPEGKTATQEASMLNLSADGLACRVASADSAEIYVGDRVDLRFDLPQSDAPFEFVAVVANRTPASDDAVILGVQFLVVDDEPATVAAQRRLRDCLYQSRTDQVPSPVSDS